MPSDFGPIRIFKCFGRPLEVRITKPAGRTPILPLRACESFSVASHHLAAAFRRHEPLVLVRLGLFETRGWQLARLPAYRYRHYPRDALRNGDRQRDVSNTCTPVVANHCKFLKIKRIRE